MIIRANRQIQVRDGEFRGVWSGNKVILRLPTMDFPVKVDDFTSKDGVDVVAVVVGGWMVAETLQKMEAG